MKSTTAGHKPAGDRGAGEGATTLQQSRARLLSSQLPGKRKRVPRDGIKGKEPRRGAHPTPVFRQQRLNRAALFPPLRSLALLDASLPTCPGKSQLRLEPEDGALCQAPHAHCLRGGPNVAAQGGDGGSEKALACPEVPLKNTGNETELRKRAEGIDSHKNHHNGKML